MAKSRAGLKILLLQIREGGRVREEEHLSFASYSGLEPQQIDILNVFDTPVFPITVADEYDALFVGGASEANVLKPEQYPFVHSCRQLLKFCADTGKPVFASCFGFQLAVQALGGEILHQDDAFEMGTVPVFLTEASIDDPLFRDTPNGFAAVSVHRQYAAELPAGCEVVAYTSQCIHVLRVTGKPFWGFQFHPEVDRKTLVERLTHYKVHYTDSDGHLDRVLAEAVETPESNQLVAKFVDRVLLE